MKLLKLTKNFPCRSASRPGDTPTSVARDLCLSAVGVDGVADLPNTEARNVAILVNASLIAADVD